jgi:hypothetical protein
LLATQLDAFRVLGLVSFDCHPGSPFFLTSKTHVVISRLYLLLSTPLTISPQKVTLVPTTTLTLSLLRMSLARSVCSDVPTGLSRSMPPAARALRITLNFFPWKVSTAVGRPATCATAKGASEYRPRHPQRYRRDRGAAFDPPPHDRARLVESPRQSGN